ncbi:MAG: hypothetical protein ACXW3J_04225 [Methylocystis sp.]
MFWRQLLAFSSKHCPHCREGYGREQEIARFIANIDRYPVRPHVEVRERWPEPTVYVQTDTLAGERIKGRRDETWRVFRSPDTGGRLADVAETEQRREQPALDGVDFIAPDRFDRFA